MTRSPGCGRAAPPTTSSATTSQRDGSFTHTFDEAGEYEYECTLHGGMTGLITVTDA